MCPRTTATLVVSLLQEGQLAAATNCHVPFTILQLLVILVEFLSVWLGNVLQACAAWGYLYIMYALGRAEDVR